MVVLCFGVWPREGMQMRSVKLTRLSGHKESECRIGRSKNEGVKAGARPEVLYLCKERKDRLSWQTAKRMNVERYQNDGGLEERTKEFFSAR